MKNISFLMVAVCALAACAKSSISVQTGIYGKWELRKTYGGLIQQADSIYKPYNGNIFQFNIDSTYKSYTNGTLTQSGVFHIIKKSGSQSTAEPNEEIYFDNNTSFKSFITISATTLTLVPVVPDIGTRQYSKIAN